MPRKIFFIILAIVVIPVSMTCWKIVQYARVSKTQIFDLHRHIAHTLSLNTTAYFQQLNMRLAFAPLLARSPNWSEQLSILNSALLSNSDFACVVLVDAFGKEKTKAFDASLPSFSKPLNFSDSPVFQKVSKTRNADAGPVYEQMQSSFFDIFYPLENGEMIVISVRWESLKALLFDQQVGTNGFIWLLDEGGRVIGDSQQAHVGETYSQWPFFKDRIENPVEWLGEFVDPHKVPMVGAGAWIKGTGWFVLSAQPQVEAYAKAWQLRRSAFFWMLFSFIGMGWFGYFWVKFISFPITQLAAGVSNVTQRKFNKGVPENFGLEEFHALGQAFNKMMSELKSYEDLQVEKIIEKQTTLQSLLFSIQDGILMLGEKGEILFANEPARQWIIDVAGRGKTFDYAWNSLQEYPPWNDALDPVIRKEKPSMSEEFEFPVQGRPRWARVMAQQVSTESKRLLGIMVVIHDVTQDKEVDRMKEDFFNGITHDLRTPLAATIGYLGLTEIQASTDPEMTKLVGSARQSAKRALGLVETILNLARLQAGKLQLQKVPVQAQAVLSKIVNETILLAQMKKIAISYDCPDASLWASADNSLLERVIENLAGNAIKYTMENGHVILKARAVPEGVEFAIEDNGRGIPQEALKSLFSKFGQVKAEDRSVGFGIGLSFSKGIIEAHGSSIHVDSEVGKGSRFYFVLARVEAPATAQSTPAAA